jgi:menaquinone-specific isochorismate synthase
MADYSTSNVEPPLAEIVTAAGNDEKLDRFLEDIFSDDHCRYATFSFPIDAIDPLAYLEMCWDNSSYRYYWENPDDEFAIAGGDELLSLQASGPERFQSLTAKIEEIKEASAQYSAISHSQAGMIFLGGFSFFDDIQSQLWDSFAPASFTLPRWMIVKNGKFNIATIAVDLANFETANQLRQHLGEQLDDLEQTVIQNTVQQDAVPDITSGNFSLNNGAGKKNWTASITAAKNKINNNEFEKIVLARQISLPKEATVTPTRVINNLRQQYTSCYNFLIHKSSGKTFLGSTPERLGAFRNQMLLTEALAGSIQRGTTATEDTIYEKHLSGSKKDRDEHNFVVKDIEERLRPLAQSLYRNTHPEIKKLSNVQHLYTPIRVQLKDDVSMLDVIERLHPTPAVGGYPWDNAAEHIDNLEQFDRGWYAGPVGWFNIKGDGEFAVGIRSGLFTQSEAHFFAGCGIVADSDPQTEWEETNLKLKPMLSALQYD